MARIARYLAGLLVGVALEVEPLAGAVEGLPESVFGEVVAEAAGDVAGIAAVTEFFEGVAGEAAQFLAEGVGPVVNDGAAQFAVLGQGLVAQDNFAHPLHVGPEPEFFEAMVPGGWNLILVKGATGPGLAVFGEDGQGEKGFVTAGVEEGGCGVVRGSGSGVRRWRGA